MVLNPHGELIWFKALAPAGARAGNLRVQEYEGKPVLTWWQDPLIAGASRTAGDVIVNSAYQTIAVVRAGNGYQPARFGRAGDGIEQRGVDPTEDRAVGADAQRQREHGNGREAGIFAQRACAVAHVTPKLIHATLLPPTGLWWMVRGSPGESSVPGAALGQCEFGQRGLTRLWRQRASRE